MKRWAALAVLGMTASAAACASILGIEDGVLDNVEGGTDGGGVQICEADSGAQVDTSQVFVSADNGDDANGCGTDQTPCKSLSAGIAALAKTRNAHLIYVSDGTYAESIHLPVGIEIQGGWHVRGSKPPRAWVQVCAGSLNDPTQIANVVGQDDVTVHAEDIHGTATLTNLVIKSRGAKPGESMFGIFATGSTVLTLNQVIVSVGNGGDGTVGSGGDDGGPGGGFCAPSDAGAGLPGTSGNAAPPTTFGASGAQPGVGTPGNAGLAGNAGERGVDGGCVTCVACPVAAIGAACGASTGQSCGETGASGCGGAGGRPGGAGQSGGSAIGIYTWGGAVIVNGGAVQVGNGGNGGSTGKGGSGGLGAPGAIGKNGATCTTTCVAAAACIGNGASGNGAGGAAGTGGGTGGTGGAGGPGAGGDSYGIYSGLDASVLLDGGATVKAGDPGVAGGSGGAPGEAKDRFP